MISIVVPVYDASALPMCLASLLAQTFEDWECIVVDDGPDERIDDLISAIRDPRFCIVRHAVNRGRGAARATGIAAASRPLLAWQDADDWSFPGRLAAQLARLEAEPGAAVVGTAATGVDESARCVGVRGDRDLGPRRLRPLEPPPVLHPTLMLRREVVETVGYRARFRTSEDHDFLTRALVRHAFANLGEALYAYHEERSHSLRKYWDSTRTRLVVAAEHAPRYPLRAATRAVTSLGKLGVYALATAFGAEHGLVAGRSRAPRDAETLAYEAARRSVLAVAERQFGVIPP